MPVLTAIDVLGVQRFVFSTNRVQDMVTGSFLVHWSTSHERTGALSGLVSRNAILLAGGGNAIVEFDSFDQARSFTAHYTRRLHDQAPGLEVVVVHRPFEKGHLAQALQQIQIDLAREKTERTPSAPLLGLSVTASCVETGLPAAGFDPAEPTRPLSQGVLKRRRRKEAANEHWKIYLKDSDPFAFPLELDDLGRTMGETSLIGVVHIDGNGVGEKIKKWLTEKADNGAKDDIVRREYRKWSQAIDDLGKRAFQAVVDRVRQAINCQKACRIIGKPDHLGFDLNGQWMLPLRPILLGGDDLTFVCDGRIALDLTETALDVFDKSNIPHLGRIDACAGVAIVRAHAPFARAYDLAEDLCASAKRLIKKELPKTGCALDWHIGLARPGETAEDIRKRQYRANSRDLTCRPYRLGSGRQDSETWRWLSGTLLDDPQMGLRGKLWSKRRNKVKAFPELVREGPQSVRAALEAWKVVDPSLQLPPPIHEDGFFAQKRTPLIDAMELLDVHLVLDGYQKPQAQGGKMS
ncbi:hypothetical protein [Desulfosoma sp.]